MKTALLLLQLATVTTTVPSVTSATLWWARVSVTRALAARNATFVRGATAAIVPTARSVESASTTGTTFWTRSRVSEIFRTR